MDTLVLHALFAQPVGVGRPSAHVLVIASLGVLLAALIVVRRTLQPLHELLRAVASAMLVIVLVFAALMLLVASLLASR